MGGLALLQRLYLMQRKGSQKDEADEVEEWDLAGEAEVEEGPVEGDEALEKKFDPADAVAGLGFAEEAGEG
ncbi:TPA: hypothetical protein ACH3X2_001252 [Trebouxia sp. C0005]